MRGQSKALGVRTKTLEGVLLRSSDSWRRCFVTKLFPVVEKFLGLSKVIPPKSKEKIPLHGGRGSYDCHFRRYAKVCSWIGLSCESFQLETGRSWANCFGVAWVCNRVFCEDRPDETAWVCRTAASVCNWALTWVGAGRLWCCERLQRCLLYVCQVRQEVAWMERSSVRIELLKLRVCAV